MGKSVYSLVLSDEVIELVDRYAEKRGMSRSNLINQILAEKIGYETPEKRLTDIFNEVEKLIEQHHNMRFSGLPSGSMATIMSAISYKYKPAVKYSVEIYPNNDSGYLGEIRVSFRTTNSVLLNHILNFFAFWNRLEQKYLPIKVNSEIEIGKYKRVIRLPNFMCTNSMIGEIITDYVKRLDFFMNNYFANLDNDFNLKKAEEVYKNTIAPKTII